MRKCIEFGKKPAANVVEGARRLTPKDFAAEVDALVAKPDIKRKQLFIKFTLIDQPDAFGRDVAGYHGKRRTDWPALLVDGLSDDGNNEEVPIRSALFKVGPLLVVTHLPLGKRD